jgi:periplasmic protein TonB
MASQAPAMPSMPGAPSPQGGLGTQLQQMMVGSLQGGYHNPNASRLNTGALSFDTAAWDLGPYARQVQERVQSNWHVPEAQMVLRQKGWVAIRFNILKDGTVADLQVIRSSGIPSYDQSAVDAMRSSNPLPPLPSQVTVPQLGGVFRFFYNMSDENDL